MVEHCVTSCITAVRARGVGVVGAVVVAVVAGLLRCMFRCLAGGFCRYI